MQVIVPPKNYLRVLGPEYHSKVSLYQHVAQHWYHTFTAEMFSIICSNLLRYYMGRINVTNKISFRLTVGGRYLK